MLKEGVSVLFLRRPLTSLVKGKTWRAVVFLGRIFLGKLDDSSDCEPETRTDVSAVLVVTEVPVSPSSVVTAFWDGVSLDSDREFVELQSVFSPKSAWLCWRKIEKR